MTIKITPLYGHGMGRTIPSRNRTEDLFGPSEDFERLQHSKRCQAAKDFLEGRRPNPDLSAYEMNYGTDLGSDDFDRSFAARRVRGGNDDSLVA